MVSLDNEVFALRNNEVIQLFTGPLDSGRWLAVQARSIEMPTADRTKVRACDGAPVEQAAIVACEWNPEHGGWQWVPLSSPTKERIGDHLFDSGASRDVWYYLLVTSPD